MNWRKSKSEAAALPLPQPQTIHNHPQGYAGLAFAIFVCAFLGLALGYFGVVALAADAGSDNPRQDVAQTLLWIVCGGGGLYCVSVAVGKAVGNIRATNHQHNKEIMQLRNDHEHRLAQLQYQSAVTGAIGARALEGDYAMARGCLAVLAKAYNTNRPYTTNESRPWVRDNAWRLISAAGVQGIKWGDCNGVKGWLEENGFVVGNQLNRVKYPHFEDARRAVDLIAAPPILINPPALPYRETTSVIK